MPRIPTGEPKVRLNLELTERVRDRLERLRSETEADTLVEVVRRALAVYDTLIASRENEEKLIIRSRDGAERELLVI